MKSSFNILAIGDIVGSPGRNILISKLQGLIDRFRIDFVIANGENSAAGMSVTASTVREILAAGVDVVTTGNHIWNDNDILSIIDSEQSLIRPANYPPGVPGKGYVVRQKKGMSICIINLIGRTFMTPLDCPFRKFDEIYRAAGEQSDIVVVDLHAESTSEKRAFGWYVDGRASAVFGTHTHVQTADETVLERGTGYITDVGMTGSFDSVIGMQKELSIERFLRQTKVRFKVADRDCRVNGIIFEIGKNGRTESVKRIAV
ncbi:MAG: TIGR00282 family metallophosphoesterase [Spirochaetes bacterium]|nr:TIGR00282 family metallophosphoesterase [Spirochaetota bacterium]